MQDSGGDAVEAGTIPRTFTLDNKHEWDGHSDPCDNDDTVHHDLACPYAVIGVGSKLSIRLSVRCS